MNRQLLIGTMAGVGVIACAAACAKSGTCQKRNAQKQMVKPAVWEKMRKGMEEMPEDFPPRVMFDNVEATRANTDEILSLLTRQSNEPIVAMS